MRVTCKRCGQSFDMSNEEVITTAETLQKNAPTGAIRIPKYMLAQLSAVAHQRGVPVSAVVYSLLQAGLKK